MGEASVTYMINDNYYVMVYNILTKSNWSSIIICKPIKYF